jgi:uncharacterized protein YcbX
MRVAALYRYPVKGLSPEPLERVRLNPGEFFPGDRLYAVENGPSGFDPAAPAHQPKIKFLMLARNTRLARLATRYDDATSTLLMSLEAIKPIDRCFAIDVAPGASSRDTDILPLMERGFGHHDCGIYARIIAVGEIAVGDEIVIGG